MDPGRHDSRKRLAAGYLTERAVRVFAYRAAKLPWSGLTGHPGPLSGGIAAETGAPNPARRLSESLMGIGSLRTYRATGASELSSVAAAATRLDMRKRYVE